MQTTKTLIGAPRRGVGAEALVSRLVPGAVLEISTGQKWGKPSFCYEVAPWAQPEWSADGKVIYCDMRRTDQAQAAFHAMHFDISDVWDIAQSANHRMGEHA